MENCFHVKLPRVPASSETWDLLQETIPALFNLIFLPNGVVSVPSKGALPASVSSVVDVIASVLACILTRRRRFRFIPLR